jgi:anti-sigma regulatory factor (Ser/Thr protein kinase)
MVFAFIVPSSARAPGRVRSLLRDELRSTVEQRLRDDLELLLTELVTNAVRYGSSEDDEIAVRVELMEHLVSVSITDAGVGFDRDALGRTPENESGGFGLLLLDRLSTRWGIERDERGFRVWFKLDR